MLEKEKAIEKLMKGNKSISIYFSAFTRISFYDN